uniref:Pyruvate kinase n=1 Tax=Tanacetum cinerariifolium TaxID=118510 RepID=A0A6L2KJ70_TANCI|nr:pyruvate kinase [Tanacetum cinerariifolium]
MFDIEDTLGRLTLYLDHLDMNLLEYLSEAITYDIDALVSKKIGPPKRGIAMTFFVDEMVDWAMMKVEIEGVEARTSTTEGVEAKNSTTEGDVLLKLTPRLGMRVIDDSDYQSDKSVDYLSLGKDELIGLRNMMKANRKKKAKAKDKPDEEINESNEKITADKDGITEDPFISVEKHVERYAMYDKTTHYRLRKPKVGEKYTSAQFKECLTYYGLANGFSLWYETSEEVRVVAKCGQRPPRLSYPEKCKQRKQNKANPDIRLCDIAELVMKKYKCKVSLNQCTNAKKYALIEYEKSIDEHYSMLRSYEKTILDFNPVSTMNGRQVVGKCALDGCFLKSLNQGDILTAVGISFV